MSKLSEFFLVKGISTLLRLVKSILLWVEKFLLKNLTLACITLTGMIWYLLYEDSLLIEFALTSIGAVLVFWYWYKKYERDKEIDMIKYYSERYTRERARGYAWVLNLWYEEFYLKEKWYISKDLWEEWDYQIKEDIKEFYESDFDKYFYDYDYNYNQDLEEIVAIEWDFCKALKPFDKRLFSKKQEGLEKGDSIGDKFCSYLIIKVREYFSWKEADFPRHSENIDYRRFDGWLEKNKKLLKSELSK